MRDRQTEGETERNVCNVSERERKKDHVRGQKQRERENKLPVKRECVVHDIEKELKKKRKRK